MGRVGQIAGDAPRWKMDALCMSISAEEFTGWLRKCGPGDQIRYASGAVLDGKRDVVVLARTAQAGGEVMLLQRRREQGGFDYLARRVATERATSAPVRTRQRDPDPESEPGRVLALLKRTANFGLPCPTNREIALTLRLNDAERARYLVGQLADDGHLTVNNRGPRITRVVTITSTGKRTSVERTPVGRGFSEDGRG